MDINRSLADKSTARVKKVTDMNVSYGKVIKLCLQNARI